MVACCVVVVMLLDRVARARDPRAILSITKPGDSTVLLDAPLALRERVRRNVEQGPHVVYGDATVEAHISTRIDQRSIPLRGRIHRLTPTEPAPPAAGAG